MTIEISSEAVREFRCFQELNDWEAGVVAGLLEEVRLPAGAVLFYEGDPGDAVYLLVSGTVQLRVNVPGFEDCELAVLEPGGIFGEIGLLLGEPRSATAAAVAPVVLWKVSRQTYETALLRVDSWANKFLLILAQVLARRLGTVDRELVRLLGRAERNAPSQLPPAPRAADLEELRRRLSTDWSF